ncbi:MAG: threonine synthase [Kiritimatiellae bacterium]|nr:threonine synthase [Kiritimatiellia bacterium]NLD89790.1 threonine synthase [Lentisphaerota bacterium]HPC19489.1 threonine synthase [Kiritimatiellia bacterium]HQQ59904.1 threonine synthase [Kiritimatiellia bacterium]
MRYISTRGTQPPLSFFDAVMTGLARDGGLLIPDRIPNVTEQLRDWEDLDYPSLAFEIMRLFADEPGDARLRELIAAAYATFEHPEIAPIRKVGGLHVLELFHGPTLAFKDIALQFLGRLFEEILEERDARLNILAATSGDTGSAAIAGVRGQPRIHIFVMHPHGRVSPLQERQMTSVLDANVFNLAVKGSFDDCQLIMKTLFRDLPFKDAYALGSVNSVNWSRVLSQIVYYFHAALRVRAETGADQVQFAVPTGNFGDILAGWYAKRMGLPVRRLILATNENDILARFFNTGTYARGAVVPSINPSMDIQVASNFERWLYYKVERDPQAVSRLMTQFAREGRMEIPRDVRGRVDVEIVAGSSDTKHTLETIRRYHETHNYLLDPHTAAGIYVAEQYNELDDPMICLATAHPAKFPEAIATATGQDLAHHPILDAFGQAPTRCEVVDNNVEAVRAYLAARAR